MASITQELYQVREESVALLKELSQQTVFLQQQSQEVSKQFELVEQRNAEKDQAFLQLKQINEINEQKLKELGARMEVLQAEKERMHKEMIDQNNAIRQEFLKAHQQYPGFWKIILFENFMSRIFAIMTTKS